MRIAEAPESLAIEMLLAAARRPELRHLIRVDMTALCGRAGFSTTIVRRFLRGEHVGLGARTRIAQALGVATPKE